MIFQNKTKTIKRSQITLNPLNPKRHSEEVIKLQAKNLKKVGFLGGIVWNESTGNVIDGHRRIYAMDSINKYDGSPDTDYDIEVTFVNFDAKTEKEQMTYMAVGNTKADINMIGEYIKDIDYKDIGLSDVEINSLLKYAEVSTAEEELDEPTEIESIFDFAPTPIKPSKATEGLSYEERKQMVKDAKAKQREEVDAISENSLSYLTIKFDSQDEKFEFLQILGIDGNPMTISGADLKNMLE